MANEIGSVENYVSQFPENIQEILKKISQIIKENAPGVTEEIAYDMPSYKLNGQLVMHFAAYKKHISLFGITLESFKEELAPLLHHAGTIQLSLEKPIPYDLIERLVKARLKELS